MTPQCEGGEPRAECAGKRTGRAESPRNAQPRRHTTRAGPRPGMRAPPRTQRLRRRNAPRRPRPPHLALRPGSFSPNSTAGRCGSKRRPRKLGVARETRKQRTTLPQTQPRPHTPGATRRRAHGASGLHFPEFTRAAFLSGSARDHAERLDYASQNAEGEGGHGLTLREEVWRLKEAL